MALSANFTPYSTVKNLMPAPPDWLDEEDGQRVLSYQVYEEIYWNVPTIFQLDSRGTDNKPIYVPTAKTIIETTNRFVGRGLEAKVLSLGAPQDQQAANDAFQSLWIREKFRTKFSAQKRFGLIRGDSFWHIVGNATAQPGKKISIYEVDPGSVFWIYDPSNLSRVTGVHIAEMYHDNKLNKDVIRRQTYRKQLDEVTGALQAITSELTVRDPKDWDNDTVLPLLVTRPEAALPKEITSLPVYHTVNFRNPDAMYGSSQLRGFERLMSALNQSVSDEELTLALDGIGMYATTSGPPTDENDDETDWVLGPGRVVEHAVGSDFVRVTGVSSVAPMTELQNTLKAFLYEGAGTPDAARGLVDVTVATSGIALTLQMGPMLAQVDEKNDLIAETQAHMYFDLQHGWFPAYEGWEFPTAVIEPQFGPTLPEDIDSKLDRILKIAGVTSPGSGLIPTPVPIVSAAWVRNELTKIGYEFPPEIDVQIVQELQTLAAAADPFGSRLKSEVPDEPVVDADVE